MARCTLVKFTQLNTDMKIKFGEKQWAQCLLCMAENMETFRPPAQPDVFEVEKVGDDE